VKTEEEASETFWWNQDGILCSLKTDSAAILTMMWIALILASLSTFIFNAEESLLIVWVFLVGCTVVWWTQIKQLEKWLDEHYGDWEEGSEAILGSQRVSKGGRRDG
jgi:hypothetical protein